MHLLVKYSQIFFFDGPLSHACICIDLCWCRMADARGLAGGGGVAGETDAERSIREVNDLESQGPDHDLCYSYLEIKNEVWAESHLVYGTALRRWDRMYEYMSTRMERRLTRRAELNTDIFNIVGFFSVFQGVVLTAVSQLKSDTHSTCGLIWFPTILSSLAAVAAIIGVSLRFSNLGEVAMLLMVEATAVNRAMLNAGRLRRLGENFRFYEHTREMDYDSRVSPFPSFKYSLVIFALILFTAIFIMSYFAILCNRLVVVK